MNTKSRTKQPSNKGQIILQIYQKKTCIQTTTITHFAEIRQKVQVKAMKTRFIEPKEAVKIESVQKANNNNKYEISKTSNKQPNVCHTLARATVN